jgi:hypothetical protein
MFLLDGTPADCVNEARKDIRIGVVNVLTTVTRDNPNKNV